MQVHPREYVETPEGLVFAVVAGDLEQGTILCFLRYLRSANGLIKYTTDEADKLLADKFPRYLYYSSLRDVHLHGVHQDRVSKHFRPREGLFRIRRRSSHDAVEAQLLVLLDQLDGAGLNINNFGVTGSLLIGAQNADSDIDLVVYGRESFFETRRALGRLLESGCIERLNEDLWRKAYQKRGCALSYREYIWHEQRKLNKVSVGGIKVDLSLVAEESVDHANTGKKMGARKLEAVILEDRFSFDHPAVYSIRHKNVSEIVSFTPTYSGQAKKGERIEAHGILEQSPEGTRRLVIGSSREACGEFIRVKGACS